MAATKIQRAWRRVRALRVLRERIRVRRLAGRTILSWMTTVRKDMAVRREASATQV